MGATLMFYKRAEVPMNLDALGIIGYLIVANKQIHSFQIDALEKYLFDLGYTISDTVLNDILNGSDNSISYSSASEAFSLENTSVQEEIIYMLYVIAYADNIMDTYEIEIIEKALSISGTDNVAKEKIKEKAISDVKIIQTNNNVLFSNDKHNNKKSLWNKIIYFIKKLFHIKSSHRSNYVADIDYKKSIEQCAEIALEDFSIIKPAYNNVIGACSSTIKEINKYKREMSLETDLSAEVAEAVGIFVDKLNSDVLEQNKKMQQALEQKERSVSDFTISLLGRTKAGKSTLHAILTNQGKDRIGVGMQRTTRYNRVYQWNLLRLIDTPGIGSAEAAGRSDDEIAESVLGESDVICFVVVDDSILKDILEFIEKIAKLNKPIIILLNHKENIRPEVKFKQFISKPDDWLLTEGESSLKGHMNRIKKYADEHGFGSLVKIYPVFLLPALMSSEPEYEKYSDMLWKHSNISSFIDQLKVWVSTCGSIKRSQTIIDEAVCSFEQSRNTILQAENIISEQITRLNSQRNVKINKLKGTATEVKTKINEVLTDKFNELANNHALTFAEEVYAKKVDLNEEWVAYVKRIGFEQEVIDAIEEQFNVYRKQAKDIVDEMFEDFYFSVKASFKSSDIKIPVQIDFKAITRIVGSVFGVAGAILVAVLASNPIGWILTGVSILCAIGASLFTSKEKKRQKAIDKIYTAVRDGILDSMDKEITKTVSEIETNMKENTKRVESLFLDLANGLQKTLDMSGELSNIYLSLINKLNKIYAWRIVCFLKRCNVKYSEEIVYKEIISVDRMQKGKMTIRTMTSVPKDTSILEGVIAEKVIIERR